jgi:ribosomal protein S18 acetylase RimI-like enzyme
MTLAIRPYLPADRNALVSLWSVCELVRPWNDPDRDIEAKLARDPDNLLVLEEDGELVGSVMVGYEGHRGWINFLAIHPEHQRRGLGRSGRLLPAAWVPGRRSAEHGQASRQLIAS